MILPALMKGEGFGRLVANPEVMVERLNLNYPMSNVEHCPTRLIIAPVAVAPASLRRKFYSVLLSGALTLTVARVRFFHSRKNGAEVSPRVRESALLP